MILATDVHYPTTGGAWAAGILFDHWSSNVVQREIVVQIDEVAPYEPGSFYKRELPCLLALIEQLPALPSLILVDGYVDLGASEGDGLGMHLYHALSNKVPVVGVAKNSFKDTPAAAEVRRGTSRRPVYVTAVGMGIADAQAGVRAMDGAHRIPTMLRKVDLLCRQEGEDV